MVLSGKRNLSEKSLLKLQVVLKLNQDQYIYFKSLISLSDEPDSHHRLKAFEEIKKIRNFRQKSVKELEVYQYLSNWICVAIRELALRRDFKADAEWIRERLVRKVPTKDVEISLQFLVAQKFLTKDSTGQMTASQKQLDCFTGVYRISLGEFHKQMFSHAVDSIDLTPRDQRNLLGHTLLIPDSKIEELRTILDETLKKVEALVSDFHEPGPVYHVILATFPIAKKGKE